MRPVAELMYVDFSAIAMDQIVNQVAKVRYMFGGKAKASLVIRTQGGAGRSSAAQHAQSLEAWFVHIPGLKVVQPSTPYDAKGLLKSAIRDDNPVMFLEHKLLYPIQGPVPEEEYLIPLGQADIKRAGSDVTVVATSRMVHRALSAAEKLALQGIEVEVIDPRTLNPLDEETILASVRRTQRLVVVYEAYERCGIGAEIAALVASKAIDSLDAPIERIAAFNTPVPFNPKLENFVIPNEERIIAGIKRLLGLTDSAKA
jgi:pyruvate/2-oxoglutarate/acetoin dehydrogenase E1 component